MFDGNTSSKKASGTYVFMIFSLAVLLNKSPLYGNDSNQFLIGFGKADITYIEDSLGLFGFGDYEQRIDSENGLTSRLFSRVISIKDPTTEKFLIYLHADLGGIFEPIRAGLIDRIQKDLLPNFDPASLLMSASHTHCAPSGLSHYAIYMASAPGYNPDLVNHICDNMFVSVKEALENEKPLNIRLKRGTFEADTPIAFNRALKAYNKNPDKDQKFKKEESNLAVNREMPLLSFEDEKGQVHGLINWFGVHPIEVLDDHDFIDGASKGYAALAAELELPSNGVAIFAQSSAGDIMTSDYHNVERFESLMKEVLNDTAYSHNVTSLKQAKWNGEIQANKALEIAKNEKKLKVKGKIDYELIYIDLAGYLVDQEFAHKKKNAQTSSPVLGASFFTGLFYWKDKNLQRTALNTFSGIGKLTFKLKSPFVNRTQREYRNKLYKFHSPKKIVVDGIEKSFVGLKLEDYYKKPFTRLFYNSISDQELIFEEVVRELKLGALKEHSILPRILPIQIIRIGNIAIAGLPTEITTIAYNRLQKTILQVLEADGVEEVLISSYANEYAGYTTTYEEYLVQRYEGGHTLFGKHQLGAFQTAFKNLGQQMLLPKSERVLDRSLKAPVFSKEELDKRSNLKPLE